MSEKPLSVSYSGASTLQECERKYCFKYLMKIEKDTDFVSPDYFAVGNAFHKVLELTKHDYRKFPEIDFKGILKSYKLDVHEDGGRIAAMLRKYWILHMGIPLDVIDCELKFEGTYTNGIIDAVMVERGGSTESGLSGVKGAWWIVDLKTAGKMDSALPSRLQNDPQLNLYAAFRSVVSDKHNLDPNLFAGVRYREAIKPGQHVKAGESFEDWTRRCESGAQVREIVIPASRMDLKRSYDEFSKNIAKAHELQSEFYSTKALVGKCNFKACLSYSKPCEYYSKCYGRTYTESQRTTLINTVGVDQRLVSLGSLFDDSEEAASVVDDLVSEFSTPANPDDFI